MVRPTEAAVWRIGGDFSFANYEDILHRLKKLIARLPQKEEYKVHTTNFGIEGVGINWVYFFQKVVILDLSSVSYMDQSAGKNLKEWIIKMDKDFQAAVLLAGPSGRTEAMMFAVEMEMSGVFPTIVDALMHVEKNHRDFELEGGHANGGVVHDDDEDDVSKKKDEADEVAVDVGWATVVRQTSAEEEKEQSIRL